MSALAQKADIDWRQLYVRFVPKAEVARTDLCLPGNSRLLLSSTPLLFRASTHGSRPVYGRIMGLAMADVPIGHARISAANAFDFQSNVLLWILASAAMLLALMVPALVCGRQRRRWHRTLSDLKSRHYWQLRLHAGRQ